MIIDKDKLKEYIHTKYGHKYRVVEIHTISIRKVTFYWDEINQDSRYYLTAKKNRSVQIDMIKIEWSGCINEYYNLNTWIYSDKRTNQFNLDLYKEWLVDIRDKKLEELLDYTLD